MKIVTIAGARPNFVKLAPIAWELKDRPNVDHLIIHTGQHYDAALSDSFFETLDIPHPQINLGVGSSTHGVQTGKIMIELEPVLEKLKPDWVITLGDVNSTVAATLVAVKLGVKTAHVESGLRSFDRTMPEEINRIVTDSISDLLFVTEQSGLDNLFREGVEPGKIHFVGNVMIDVLVKMLPIAKSLQQWSKYGLNPSEYLIVTLHRPSNVDKKEKFYELCDALIRIASYIPIILPLHPRTKANIAEFGLLSVIGSNSSIKLIEPLDYLKFLSLVSQAKMVLTDSGGIQEETTFLGIPCMTIRYNTERPITVEKGTNELVPPTGVAILNSFEKLISDNWKNGQIPPLWDGNAAKRIVDILLSIER